MIGKVFRFILVSFTGCAATAFAGLEIPGQDSIQSGIGVVSGWTCDMRNIQVRFDDFPLLDAGSRTPRGDTVGVCGGRTDTGFSLLFNYNALSPGTHRVTVLADGFTFGSATFKVVNAGVEYMTGKKGQVWARHFPDLGDFTTLTWDEEKQNFSISRILKHDDAFLGAPTLSGEYAGTYYGSTRVTINNAFLCGPVPPGPPPVLGTFQVAIDGDRLTLVSQSVDGSSCTATGQVGLKPGFEDASYGPDWVASHSGSAQAILGESSCDTLKGATLTLDGQRLAVRGGGAGCHSQYINAISATR